MSAIQRSIQVGWQLRVFFTENVLRRTISCCATRSRTPARARRWWCWKIRSPRRCQDWSTRSKNIFPPTRSRFASSVRRCFFAAANAPRIHRPSSRNCIRRFTAITLTATPISSPSAAARLLDVAGFAAATAHRGVRLVRIPTTTLSQADSGVGVKNGSTPSARKISSALYAAFRRHQRFQPARHARPPRDKRSGYVEAVKVACIRDAKFFDELERDAEKLAAFEPEAMKRLIRRCAELHLDHIATSGDPFEAGSARPLDFGHWSAHKLEQLSHFQHFPRRGRRHRHRAGRDLFARTPACSIRPSAARILNLLEKLGFKLFAENCSTPTTPTCRRSCPAWRNSANTSAANFPSRCWRKSAAAWKSTK
jgi:hypothetical protein